MKITVFLLVILSTFGSSVFAQFTEDKFEPYKGNRVGPYYCTWFEAKPIVETGVLLGTVDDLEDYGNLSRQFNYSLGLQLMHKIGRYEGLNQFGVGLRFQWHPQQGFFYGLGLDTKILGFGKDKGFGMAYLLSGLDVGLFKPAEMRSVFYVNMYFLDVFVQNMEFRTALHADGIGAHPVIIFQVNYRIKSKKP